MPAEVSAVLNVPHLLLGQVLDGRLARDLVSDVVMLRPVILEFSMQNALERIHVVVWCIANNRDHRDVGSVFDHYARATWHRGCRWQRWERRSANLRS